MEKGYVPTIQKENMPALTYRADTREQGLIDEYVTLRKELNISQTELAEMIGSKQQAVSRVEKKEHCPSLKLFCSMVNALGYELQLVKKN
ncbi:MAG: helix-turn-helix transcriptional regulator [Lachnospiraceae bacterium]|nr:helix-turn-helix transcriptional regulator [Lachnospiraceae bacterium]